MKAGNKVEVFYGNDYFFGIVRDINGGKALVYIPELDEEAEVKAHELECLKDVKLNKDEFRKLCRLEKGIPDYVGEDGYAECIVNSDRYEITASDLLAAVDVMIERDLDSSELFLEWYRYFEKMLEEDRDCALYSERGLVISILTELDKWVEYDAETDLELIRRQIAEFVEDADKPVTERRYPDCLKAEFLNKYEKDYALNRASEEEVALYRIFAEDLSEKGEKVGLLALGYGCYGGNRAFECNWEIARDCMLKLVDTVTDMPDRAFYANTLGYIYYYGRCNGGVPQYEEAYKYFSFAAFYGVYEAQYKIADMYKNGYGVMKCPETFDRIISDLYNENLKYIVNGEFDSKFADVALRMGDTYDDDIMFYDDRYRKLCCYMQADFAIRMRMLTCNYYGDDKVCSLISDVISKTRAEMNYRPVKKVRYDTLEEIFAPTFAVGGELMVSVRPLKDRRYKLTFKDSNNGKLFITVPELELCGLYDKFSVVAVMDMDLDREVKKDILINEIDYSGFKYNGEQLLWLPMAEYEITAPSGEDKTFRIATVIFSEGACAQYDYICEDKAVKEGDLVTVIASGEEKTVRVIRITVQKASQLKLPLSRYKNIQSRI